MTGFRLQAGGCRINRAMEVNFNFDGKSYKGYEGDTLASALIANDQLLMGRSFKYHRPRGCLTHGFNEPNALVELGEGARREPNIPATSVPICSQTIARSQNRVPSLSFDFLAINQWLSPFIGAGFYYKTFMWPASFWEPVYEKLIRRSAGLGKPPVEPDPDFYEHAHEFCDILVVGAGITGLVAALQAARSGAKVVLVEQDRTPGGMTSPKFDRIENRESEVWVSDTLATLSKMENVRLLMSTLAFGYYDHNVIGAVQQGWANPGGPEAGKPRQRMWVIRAKQVILCCGSHERAMNFGNNDCPGIMLSRSVRHFAEHYGVACGRNIVVCTNNDDAYFTAQILRDLGIHIAEILDCRAQLPKIADALSSDGVNIVGGVTILRAKGNKRVQKLLYRRAGQTSEQSITCDCVAMSGGFSPDVNLSSQTGVAPIWDEALAGFLPGLPTRAEQSAGACNGKFTLQDCLEDGINAAKNAVKNVGHTEVEELSFSSQGANIELPVQMDWELPNEKNIFIDFQNDVTAKDIVQAHQEGFVSVEHLKRYTTLGMATDQGKTSNINGIGLLARERQEPIQNVGTTRFRPPYSPVSIGVMAGHERGKEFQPIRRTAMHKNAEQLGAVFTQAGQWLRPWYYPQRGEDIFAASLREARQVRQTVGMCDISSLGKIELFGADVGEFLNRLYTNAWKKLPIGRARYGVMLREDGIVFDDGTTSRLGENHYFMTTTTANAAPVLAHMEHAAQVLWPELDVHFCSATEQWCGVSVAGPNARNLLQDVFGDAIDLSNSALPFMGVATFNWQGLTTRIFRVSFSGELAYEVNIGWQYGHAMWNAIWEKGPAHGLVAYGLEALSILRIEKGHVAGGELDGRTTATDLGLGRMVSTKKPFIGEKLAQRSAFLDEQREQLVGLVMQSTHKDDRLRGGAHLVKTLHSTEPGVSLGWVSSVCKSPALGSWIGLGFLKGGWKKNCDQILYASSPLHEEHVKVRIVSPHFFDPEGERLDGQP